MLNGADGQRAERRAAPKPARHPLGGSADVPVGRGANDLTGVLDIGKTRLKLLLVDEQGQPVLAVDRANASVDGPGYTALDTPGIEAWLADALQGLGAARRQLRRLIVSAHGAGVAALRGDALALPVPDYEFAGFDERPANWRASLDDFAESFSPDLPRGLNIATQLDWLSRHHGAVLEGADTLLPWAQYWGWWLTGRACSEVSSLGCHSHLWRPQAGTFSALAQARGWAQRFAPLARAWEVLGPVRPELATRLGLPPGVAVHVGVHDSNACLAAYLHSWPRMTLVSSGTWVVTMAPGAPGRRLDAARDMLGNVSVRGELVPTARFMGGRELAALCAGADPALASLDEAAALVAAGVQALPAFADQGGPFAGRHGQVLDGAGQALDLAALPPATRASLAALYVAQMIAWQLDALGGAGPVVLDGPFAHNPVIRATLAALLPPETLHVNADELEGTARGAWVLSRWTQGRPWAARTTLVDSGPRTALQAHQQAWRARLS